MTSDIPNFDTLWNYDDPAATEAAFRQVLPQVRASGDASAHAEALDLFERGLAWRQACRRDERDDGGIRIARWCVARALRSLGRVEHALTMQRALLADLERAGARDGYVFEEIGECLLSLGRADEAKLFFAQAHAELSKDSWLAAHEQDRLRRLKEMSS
jgi:tetratricopeptide (TPR) repeat protein